LSLRSGGHPAGGETAIARRLEITSAIFTRRASFDLSGMSAIRARRRSALGNDISSEFPALFERHAHQISQRCFHSSLVYLQLRREEWQLLASPCRYPPTPELRDQAPLPN